MDAQCKAAAHKQQRAERERAAAAALTAALNAVNGPASHPLYDLLPPGGVAAWQPQPQQQQPTAVAVPLPPGVAGAFAGQPAFGSWAAPLHAPGAADWGCMSGSQLLPGVSAFALGQAGPQQPLPQGSLSVLTNAESAAAAAGGAAGPTAAPAGTSSRAAATSPEPVSNPALAQHGNDGQALKAHKSHGGKYATRGNSFDDPSPKPSPAQRKGQQAPPPPGGALV